VLGAAETVPGWTTKVDSGKDGTATAVHWTGGRIPPKTFGQFALRGRTPATAGALAFKTVQRYERESDSWTGPAGSEKPAPVLTVRAGAGGGTPASARPAHEVTPAEPAQAVGSPVGTAAQGSPGGTAAHGGPGGAAALGGPGGSAERAGGAGAPDAADPLSRSRSALALVLALAALLCLAAVAGRAVLNRPKEDAGPPAKRR
jgi:hypothetical protein